MGSISDPRFTRLVDAIYPRDDLESLGRLIDDRDAARALIGSAGWAVLSALLSEDIAQLDAELDTDRPLESRAHYAARHGRRGGLTAPYQALMALIARAETRLAEAERAIERGAESSQQSRSV